MPGSPSGTTSPGTSSPGTTWAIVAGGGTAGHLIPGLAIAGALVERGHAKERIHFVGSDRGVEAELVPSAGYTLDELPGRGIQRRLTPANIGAVLGLVAGTVRGIRIVGRRKPAVVVVLGGHASFACGVGAVLRRVPLVLVEQNAKAGAVNRVLRRFAAASAVSFEGTDLPKAVVTGNPLRPELVAAATHPDRDAACATLGLPPERTVLAVFSGSLGSRRINTAVKGLVERWADRDDVAIRHVVGRREYPGYAASAPTPPEGGLVYQCVEYESRMDVLLQAADVAVTRGGGGVAELAAFGVPAVLVPLPIAPRDHQRFNAEALARAGGAVVVRDDLLDTDRLEAELRPLVDDDDRRRTWSAAMRSAAHLDAADRAAAVVEGAARRPR